MQLRTPRPEGRGSRPSITSIRPVAATTTPLPVPPSKRPGGALPLYITLGFTLGIGIVLAARLTLRSPAHAAASGQPFDSGTPHAVATSIAVPLPASAPTALPAPRSFASVTPAPAGSGESAKPALSPGRLRR